MDDMRFLQLYNIVKMGIPGTTFPVLKEFLNRQDAERQAWFDKVSMMDLADWVVETMREEAANAT
jgi:hypothetical protein